MSLVEYQKVMVILLQQAVLRWLAAEIAVRHPHQLHAACCQWLLSVHLNFQLQRVYPFLEIREVKNFLLDPRACTVSVPSSVPPVTNLPMHEPAHPDAAYHIMVL